MKTGFGHAGIGFVRAEMGFGMRKSGIPCGNEGFHAGNRGNAGASILALYFLAKTNKSLQNQWIPGKNQ